MTCQAVLIAMQGGLPFSNAPHIVSPMTLNAQRGILFFSYIGVIWLSLKLAVRMAGSAYTGSIL